MKRVLTITMLAAAALTARAATDHADEKAIIIHAPRPEMPYIARTRHHTGAGEYRLYISADGAIRRVTILKSTGWPELDKAAIDAFSHWRAKPSYERSIVVPAYFGAHE